MVRTRAQDQLLTNWVAIVLAVVSIIQGLAFNDLVTRLPGIYQYCRATNDARVIIHFVLCFILLLRVFQTYLTAALDYNPWVPNLFDVIIIFIVGAFEYFVFSSLTVPNFVIASFHKRFSIISVFGIFGYIGAILRVREELFPVPKNYVREVRLQIVNILSVIIVLAISVLIIIFPALSNRTQAVLASVSALVLGLNIYYSLRTTFPARTDEVVAPEKIENTRLNDIHEDRVQLNVIIKLPERENVLELAHLLVQHFSYFYTAVFDTSVRLTQRILKSIFLINGGKHPLGYRAFYIVCDEETGKTVGFFMLKTKGSDVKFGIVIGIIGAVLIVLWHLGPVGLARTFYNLRELGPIIPTTAPSELHILYLAVIPTARRRHVGKQIVEYIYGLAKSLNKQSITLEVREANKSAQQFFRSCGFTDDFIIKSEGDSVLDRGYRIHMITKIS